MALNVRRIVTGHDENGKAVVTSDERLSNVKQLRSGNFNALVWMNNETPAELDVNQDPAALDMDIEPPDNGAIFRILELVPGKQAYMHRTDTIDYAVVLTGECDMLLDDSEVHLRAGDVMVQRGTWHGWTNRGTATCQIAFILISSVSPTNHLHQQ